jgi:hypothetical protein
MSHIDIGQPDSAGLRVTGDAKSTEDGPKQVDGYPRAAGRHREGLALMARPGLAQAQILRFTRPGMARRWLRQIACP